jgi:BolA protein
MQAIQAALQVLQPTLLEVRDDSALHAGHVGAQAGGGHYHLTIVSPLFEGRRTLERHRLVYEALGDMMRHDIHALAIDARSLAEHPKP